MQREGHPVPTDEDDCLTRTVTSDSHQLRFGEIRDRRPDGGQFIPIEDECSGCVTDASSGTYASLAIDLDAVTVRRHRYPAARRARFASTDAR